MPLDSLCTAALAEELNARLSGAFTEKIHQPVSDTVILSLRGEKNGGKLLLCAGTGTARVHLTDAAFENPLSPPMFCMLLRKHLTGARILSVLQPGLERVLDVRFDAPGILGERCERHLILELISAAANLLLTDGDGRILDCLHRISGGEKGKRSLLPGLFYRLPERQQKSDPFAMNKEEKLKLLSTADKEVQLDRWLLDSFLGLSPLICREIVFRAYGSTSVRKAETPDKGGRTAEELEKILGEVSERNFTPCLLSTPEGEPRDFSFIRISQYENALVISEPGSFSELLDGFYTRRDVSEKLRIKAQGLLKSARTARDRLLRKTANQRSELILTRDRDHLRQCGDLIMANLHNMEKGDTSLTADDFYGAEGTIRVIKLDPTKSPHQNASKYYKDFTRAKNAEKHLTMHIESGEKELQYLETVVSEIEMAGNDRDLAELRLELEDAGYIKKRSAGKKEKRPAAKPMRFISSSGMDIRVGRTGAQNDELTRSAQRSDIWLHAQKIHGSHVVISCGGAEPDEKALHEAAMLAAYYSQARGGENVPVDYTMAKYVKKPSGARPGMVVYTAQKTIFVDPDEDEIQKLNAAH